MCVCVGVGVGVVCVQLLNHVRLFGTPWSVACQAPLSLVFSWHDYWPFLPPEDFPNPGTEPMSPASPALQTDSLLLSHQGSPTAELRVFYWVMWETSTQVCYSENLILCLPHDGLLSPFEFKARTVVMHLRREII